MFDLSRLILLLWGIFLCICVMVGLAYWITALVEKKCGNMPLDVQAWAAIVGNLLILPPIAALFFLLIHCLRYLFS